MIVTDLSNSALLRAFEETATDFHLFLARRARGDYRPDDDKLVRDLQDMRAMYLNELRARLDKPAAQ